jgi:hypothetical protein
MEIKFLVVMFVALAVFCVTLASGTITTFKTGPFNISVDLGMPPCKDINISKPVSTEGISGNSYTKYDVLACGTTIRIMRLNNGITNLTTAFTTGGLNSDLITSGADNSTINLYSRTIDGKFGAVGSGYVPENHVELYHAGFYVSPKSLCWIYVWNNQTMMASVLETIHVTEAGWSTPAPNITTAIRPATPVTNILDHSMASNVDESTSKVITRSNTFYNTDSKAYSWLNLGNVGAGTVEWRWYSPDGNQYYTYSLDIPMPKSGDYWDSYYFWDSINIAGSDAVNYPGDWYVDVYLDGQKLLTEVFSISGGQPTESPETQSFTPAIEKTKAQDWVGQGLALYTQSKYNEAIQAFDKAIEINPQDAKAWYERGYALDSQGKYKEAIPALDKAIELDPRNAEAWYEKGIALKAQGKYDEAQRAYDKAIEIDPLIEYYYD